MKSETFVTKKPPSPVRWWGSWWQEDATEAARPLSSLRLQPTTRVETCGIRLVRDAHPGKEAP